MNSKGVTKLMLATAFASAIGMYASNASASDAAQILADSSGAAVTYDNASGAYPVVSAIVSVGAGETIDGYTYTTYAYFAADSTGSLDIFQKAAASPYTPTLGDGISVSGTYSPFDGIPEVGTITSVTKESTGNAFSGPITATIPSIESALPNLPANAAATLVTIDNLTISNTGGVALTAGQDFLTHANTTLQINDGGGNSMVLFQYASSYSTAAAFGGTAIPTGTVNITGFLDVFDGANEFIPVAISSVPEPATLALAGLGGLSMLFLRRRSA
jgi:hypothetical protein